MIISVGDSFSTKKPCYQVPSAYASNSLIIDCKGLVGSKLFLTNPSTVYVETFEVMAFSQYNITKNGWVVSSTPVVTGSSASNILKTEMKIQTATTTACFTSVAASAPFISIQFPAAIPISGVLPFV